MQREPSLKVRQGEGRFAVAAEGRAEQLEERFVLGNRKELSFAEHPARGREIAREHPDFTNIRLSHGSAPSIRRWKNALQGNAEGQRQIRLPVLVRLAAAGVR